MQKKFELKIKKSASSKNPDLKNGFRRFFLFYADKFYKSCDVAIFCKKDRGPSHVKRVLFGAECLHKKVSLSLENMLQIKH